MEEVKDYSIDGFLKIVRDVREKNKDRDHEIRKQVVLENKRYINYLILCLPKKYRSFFMQVKHLVYTVAIVVPICEIVIYLNK